MAIPREQIAGWLILLLLACASGLAGCTESAAPETVAPGSPDTAAATTEPSTVTTPDGEALFTERCAGCHMDPDNSKAMPMPALATLNPAQLVFAMTNGSMKAQATGLAVEQMIALAAYVAGERAPYAPSPDQFCSNRSVDTAPVLGRWAVDAQSTAALPAGTSRIDSGNVARLELAWAFGLPDVANARSQGVLTADTLFVAAESGHLFALGQDSGCIRWHRDLPATPRTALTAGTVGERPALFYGDMEAHVNALDAATGETLWRADATVSPHTMLTGASVQHGGRLIVPVSHYETGLAANPEHECCVSHGAVIVLNADSGERLWTTPTTADASPQGETEAGIRRWGPSGVPVWSTPTVDAERGLVYVGTGQNASLPATELSDSVLALDLETGALVWHFQAIAGDAYNMACDQQPPGPNCPKWRGPDHDIGAAVVMTRDAAGHDRLIVGQKSGDLYALDPDAGGRVIWRQRLGAGSALGGIHWGMAVADGVIYAPVADPPFPIPNYRPAPGLYAVSVEDGSLEWERPVARDCETNLFEYFGRETLYPDCSFYYGLSAAPLKANDLVFAGALDGRLRAFRATDGQVLWETATARPFAAVNGVPTHGGSIDVGAVLAAGDMLYVQSGYGQFGELPGNALLAFRIVPDSVTP
ncbi:MAG: PQQ-binding-like beta-propeller repeat protein [Pseudomonadales bacterium]